MQQKKRYRWWYPAPKKKKKQKKTLKYTQKQLRVYQHFKKVGEDLYINYRTNEGRLSQPVRFWVDNGLLIIVGEGRRRKIVWNPKLPRKGMINQVYWQARRLKKAKTQHELLIEQLNNEFKEDVLVRSQVELDLPIHPEDEQNDWPYCDLAGTDLEDLESKKGIGLISGGKLIAFYFKGTTIPQVLPPHEDKKEIWVVNNKVYFI